MPATGIEPAQTICGKSSIYADAVFMRIYGVLLFRTWLAMKKYSHYQDTHATRKCNTKKAERNAPPFLFQ